MVRPSRINEVLVACFLLWSSAAYSSVALQSPAVRRSRPSGCASSASFAIESGTWKFRVQEHPIAYEYCVPSTSRVDNSDNSNNSDAIPVLLLNGFGMGSFHQHRLMEALHSQSQNQQQLASSPAGVLGTVYAIDYLGQGKSWPKDCNDGHGSTEQGLRYCGMTWVEQIVQFIEQVIPTQKVHLVGNSVGGHLAVFIAAARPDLVESVVLLNATPVWGLNLPGWSGHLPAPWLPKLVGRYLFDRMRDRGTIEEFLGTTYVNREAWCDTTLPDQVRACTEGPGGHAAFASILWSPPVTVALPDGSNDQAKFYDCLGALKCDVLLCFGQEDPWCKPAFAKRMLQSLQQRQIFGDGTPPTQQYVGLSNVGHCPNHESAKAAAQLLAHWVGSADCRSGQLSLLPGGGRAMTVRENWGETVVQELEIDNIPLSWIDQLAVQLL